MNRPHDADYKAFFARWEVVESLLVDFRPELGLNPVLVGNLIYARTVIANPEYVTKESKRRQADMVYQIPGRLIAPSLRVVPDVELMAEFQGTYDPEMDERILEYMFYRRGKIRLENEALKEAGIKVTRIVPQLLPVTLFFGGMKWPEPALPLAGVYDNARLGMQVQGIYPGRRLNLQTLNLDGKPMDRLMPAWCRLEQARSFEAAIQAVAPIFLRYPAPRYGDIQHALYNRGITLDLFVDKDGDRVSFEDIQRHILGEFHMPVPITMAEVMAEEGRIAGRQEGLQAGLQEGLRNQRELLCSQAEKQFNAHTARQLDTLLKTTDDPAIFAEIGEAIIGRGTDKEFIGVCRALISSH